MFLGPCVNIAPVASTTMLMEEGEASGTAEAEENAGRKPRPKQKNVCLFAQNGGTCEHLARSSVIGFST